MLAGGTFRTAPAWTSTRHAPCSRWPKRAACLAPPSGWGSRGPPCGAGWLPSRRAWACPGAQHRGRRGAHGGGRAVCTARKSAGAGARGHRPAGRARGSGPGRHAGRGPAGGRVTAPGAALRAALADRVARAARAPARHARPGEAPQPRRRRRAHAHAAHGGGAGGGGHRAHHHGALRQPRLRGAHGQAPLARATSRSTRCCTPSWTQRRRRTRSPSTARCAGRCALEAT